MKERSPLAIVQQSIKYWVFSIHSEAIFTPHSHLTYGNRKLSKKYCNNENRIAFWILNMSLKDVEVDVH